MTPLELLLYAFVIIISTLTALFIIVRFAPKALGHLFLDHEAREERERMLTERIEELERKNKYQEEDLGRKIKELELTVKVLSQQGDVANERILQLKQEIAALEKQVDELRRQNATYEGERPKKTMHKTHRVLAIWPHAPKLDQLGEKDAIFTAGVEYKSLEESEATRMGIVLELDRNNYDIMEIGAKGGGIGVQLSDGIAPPGWWLQLARQHNIDLFVVLANESSAPGSVNVADSLYSGGAKAVISIDRTIEDADAVKFARILYNRLAQGVALAKAFDFAKLVITDAGSDAIRLRERN